MWWGKVGWVGWGWGWEYRMGSVQWSGVENWEGMVGRGEDISQGWKGVGREGREGRGEEGRGEGEEA